MNRVIRRIDSPEYRQAYERGWRASARSVGGVLDRADARGESDPWYDGYFDHAAGREKWHRLHCPDHEQCP